MKDGQTIRWTSHGIDFALRVVQSYKYLGTWMQSGGCLLKEIQNSSSGGEGCLGVTVEAVLLQALCFHAH